MKKASFSSIFLALTLAALLLSACGGATQSAGESTGGGKALASPVEFTGIIEVMDGDQWTINGQVMTVDPSVLRDGPFGVGDMVKVEAEVQSDGSILVRRIERPDDDSNANGNDNSNVNANDNSNANANTNTNANTNINGNANTNTNGNSNANVNGNGNSNDNSNDDDDNGNDDDGNGNDDHNDDDDDDDSNDNGGDDNDD